MKILVKGFNYYLWLIAGVLIVMSFDVWAMDGSFFERLLGFLVHLSPGLALVIILIMIKKNQLIFGILLFFLSIGLTFVFKPFRNFSDMWFSLVAIIIPILVYSIIEINLYLHKNT